MAEQESHVMRDIQGENNRRPSTPKVPDVSHGPSRTSSITAHEPITRKLSMSVWPIMAFAIYAGLAMFSWTVFCISSRRPQGSSGNYTNIDASDELELMRILSSNEDFIKAAQIVQTISALLTIPVTSTICSMAFVAFLQSGSLGSRLSLRQTMALVDQGWISPRIWIKLFEAGSLPLYIAFTLTLIGGVFQILQQSLVQVHSIQATTGSWDSRQMVYVPDVPSLVASSDTSRNAGVVRLRSILDSADGKEFEPHLWAENATRYARGRGSGYDLCDWCIRLMLYREDDLNSFYFAPLLKGFNTGVYPKPEYAPRINTTVEYTNITLEEFPSSCRRENPDVFFAEYYFANEYYYEISHLVACVPSNISSSPWQATHNRQDITEELFLNVTRSQGYRLYKATARSSLGYFELPSVHNGYHAGPLLDELVLETGRSSRPDFDKRDINGTATYPGNATQLVDTDLGPLTSLALALFGKGSFIDTRLSNPTAYTVERPEEFIDLGSHVHPVYSANCRSLLPMNNLRYSGSSGGCQANWQLGSTAELLDGIDLWITSFHDEDSTRDTFTMGTYLANKLWFTSYVAHSSNRILYYEEDESVTTKKPMLSKAGMIAGSVLLGAHLLGLAFLALFTCYRKPWVPWLGAQYMIKAGTAYAGALNSAEGAAQWRDTVAVCPGFVGDERPTDRVGRMAFGAKKGLSSANERKFEEL